MEESTHAGAQHFCRLIGEMPGDSLVLVVGYGQGHEAAYIRASLQVTVVGIDIRPPQGIPAGGFRPIVADAQSLPFQDESFEYVFSHHVIEHIPNRQIALSEMKRVLRHGGHLYIGVPNRRRILGYVGSYGATFKQRIWWNLKDYADRLRGQFVNEMGAHAGFSQHELEELLRKSGFSTIRWLTQEYLWFKYGHRWPRWALRVVTSPAVIQFAAPSLYVLCEK